jgi:hypothetical protein
MHGRFVYLRSGERLAADLDFSTTGDDDLHFVTAARPGVGADRTTQQSLLPADGRGFGAAAGHTHANGGVAAAARWSHAQTDFDRSRWAAARIASLSTLGKDRAGGQHSDRQNNTTQHFYSPLWKIHFAGTTPERHRSLRN